MAPNPPFHFEMKFVHVFVFVPGQPNNDLFRDVFPLGILLGFVLTMHSPLDLWHKEYSVSNFRHPFSQCHHVSFRFVFDESMYFCVLGNDSFDIVHCDTKLVGIGNNV